MTPAIKPRRYRRSLILILVTGAALLRVYKLDQIPPALFRDEAEKIYNAFCLATTAHDCTGRFLPLFVEVFGVTTSTIYQYAAVPFVWLFGLGEWAARLPAAFVGTLTVWLVFLAAERLWGTRTAFWSALFLALSPWHVVFSRWAQQGIFHPLWFSVGLYCWASFLRGRTYAILGTAAALGLAFYTYDVARAFVPLFMILLCVLYHRELRRPWRATVGAAITWAVVASPVLYLLFFQTGAAQARFSRISIFQPDHSLLAVSRTFLSNYVQHFSPQFLLFRGDSELRHGAGVGILTAVEFFALIVGCVAIARRPAKTGLLLLGWIILSPLPASLTREGIPHALRAIVGIPAFHIVAGIGMTSLEKALRHYLRRFALPALVAAELIAFGPFVYRYFGDYSSRAAWNWQYGVKQAIQILQPLESSLDRIGFSKIFGAEYLVAVYAGLPSEEFRPTQARAGKYEWLPWTLPLEQWPPFRSEAVAVVTLPLEPPPPAVATIPIHAPNSHEVVAVVYLNEHARTRIRQNVNK